MNGNYAGFVSDSGVYRNPVQILPEVRLPGDLERLTQLMTKALGREPKEAATAVFERVFGRQPNEWEERACTGEIYDEVNRPGQIHGGNGVTHTFCGGFYEPEKVRELVKCLTQAGQKVIRFYTEHPKQMLE